MVLHFSSAELTTGFLDDGIAALSQIATAGNTQLGQLTLTGMTFPAAAVSETTTISVLIAGLFVLGFLRRKPVA